MADILIVDDHPIVAEGLQKLVLDKGIASKCVTVYSFHECQKILNIPMKRKANVPMNYLSVDS